ncbi:hypothetical protein [Sporosarcina sp. D27]
MQGGTIRGATGIRLLNKKKSLLKSIIKPRSNVR